MFDMGFGVEFLLVMFSFLTSAASQTTARPQQESYTVSLYEHEQQVKTLGRVDCPNARVTSVTSNRAMGTPACKICFQVFQTGTGVTHELRYMPLGSLSYRQDQNYQVTLQCTDNHNAVVKTVLFYLRIEPNTPPYFTAFFLQETRLMSQMTQFGLNLNKYCQDNDIGRGDSVTFTLRSMLPRSPFFKLSSKGLLKGVGELQRECGSPFTFVVECADRYSHRALHTLTVQLTLLDGNKAPIINGLNSATVVPEDRREGVGVGRFSVLEGGKIPVCALASSDPALSQFFELKMSGTQGDIVIKGKLNYETLTIPRTNLTVTCSDGYCTSSAAYLYVTVSDVNEPITLLPAVLTLSTYEGSISLNPNWTTIDEDKNDRHTFRLAGGNSKGRFAIHPVTGLITSTVLYDVDKNAMPASEVLVVQAEDQGRHKSSATVTVSILDSNDNAPSFFPSSSSASAVGSNNQSSGTITNCTTALGTTVDKVVATDRDSSFQGNNFITYNVTEGPFIVDRSGNVKVSGSLTGGMTYVVKVTATDAGKVPNGPLTSSPPAVVTVFVKPCPTTTTTTATATTPTGASTATTIPERTTMTPASRSGQAGNVGWITVAGMLALLLVCTAGLMLWRFCEPSCTGCKLADLCRDLCRQQPVITKVEPVKGQPPKNGNSTFWQEHYTDEDYNHHPMRDLTPSPVPVEDYGPMRDTPWRAWAHKY